MLTMFYFTILSSDAGKESGLVNISLVKYKINALIKLNQVNFIAEECSGGGN